MGAGARKKLRLRLIHWNADEARTRAAQLSALGYRVSHTVPGPKELREMRRQPPRAVVIDLTRLPSQGRDIAVTLRHSPRTRSIPIVFVGGEREKVTKVKALLPDAVYASWAGINRALKRAIRHPPSEPIRFPSVFGAYARTPLSKKLGINPGSRVAVLNGPKNFPEELAPLPTGVKLSRNLTPQPDITIVFVTSLKRLTGQLPRLAPMGHNGGLWIAWPKRSSSLESDLTQAIVRRTAEDSGLVDFKVAAFNDTWTGLRFTLRGKEKRKARRRER